MRPSKLPVSTEGGCVIHSQWPSYMAPWLVLAAWELRLSLKPQFYLVYANCISLDSDCSS